MAINSITMKIYDFDEVSNSIIVAFKSNQSTKSIDDQPRMAFQPTMFEDTDPEKVIKRIAHSGVSIAEMQDKQDALKENFVAVDLYKNKVGQSLTFTLADFDEFNAPPVTDIPADQNLTI
jgi:hypothetical protein